jgi:hypothetical protein
MRISTNVFSIEICVAVAKKMVSFGVSFATTDNGNTITISAGMFLGSDEAIVPASMI